MERNETLTEGDQPVCSDFAIFESLRIIRGDAGTKYDTRREALRISESI